MDRVTAAKVFIDVAYSRSFTATAERLEMSRPMVTHYIEVMESWLHARLLHRTTRKISLTIAGENCLKEVEIWLAQAERLSILSAPGEELSGSIRIACSTSFSFTQLIPAVSEFMSIHPKVSIDIDANDLVADLVDQQIDLAIRISSDPHPALIGRPIVICDSVLVAAPDYLQGKPAIQQPSDLSEQDCLGYKNFERHVWHLSHGTRFESIDVNCRLTANEATTLCYAAIRGMGVALQPVYLVSEYLKVGQLVRVLPEWKPNNMKVYALYTSRKHLSAGVRALIDHLQNYFVENSW